MSGFKLLETDTFWKEVVTYPDGQWVGAVYATGDPVYDYVEFEGIEEPYRKEGVGSVLPEGVSSTRAIMLDTNYTLVTYDSLVGSEAQADIIYLEDPRLVPETPAFVVHAKADWRTNGGFELLTSDSGEYICYRRGNQ